MEVVSFVELSVVEGVSTLTGEQEEEGLGLVGAKAAGQDAKGARRSQRPCFGRARPGGLLGGGVRGAGVRAGCRRENRYC
jgi:hypothetical protein